MRENVLLTTIITVCVVCHVLNDFLNDLTINFVVKLINYTKNSMTMFFSTFSYVDYMTNAKESEYLIIYNIYLQNVL